MARSPWRVMRDEPAIRYYDSGFRSALRIMQQIAAAPPDAFDPATEAGRERLHRLLERQHYRLAWWRSAGDAINWRRFFDINGLVGAADRGRGGVRGDACDAVPAVSAKG